MSDTERKAVYRITIRGTVDQVWRELTRTDRPQYAMFNSVMHFDRLAAGGQLRMRSPNGKYTGVAGTFIEVSQPVRLSHTLRFTNYDDPECTIVYDLKETPDGVEVTLTVEDLPTGTKSEKQLEQGGPFIVKNLKATVETGRPTLGARILFAFFKLLAPLNPKSTLSDNWRLPGESRRPTG